MSISRRKILALVGGGVIVAAGGGLGYAVTRLPRTASLPWQMAGKYQDPRKHALSWALLAPNPHNRQPWMANLAEPGVVTLYADPDRLLPKTDPFNRQITIGLGCFLELLRMAAAENGHRLETTIFPQGSSPAGLDRRPIARVVFTPDETVARDPLFAHVQLRRSNKEPFDMSRTVDPAALAAFEDLCKRYPDDALAEYHLERLREGETGEVFAMAEK